MFYLFGLPYYAFNEICLGIRVDDHIVTVFLSQIQLQLIISPGILRMNPEPVSEDDVL